MRKTKKHKIYSIEEKNEIVKEYLGGLSRRNDLIRKYDLGSSSVLKRWVDLVKVNGSVMDRRGRNEPYHKP